MLIETLIGGGVLAGALGGYAFGYEPFLKPREVRYRIRSERFDYLHHQHRQGLRIVALSDLHACRLWMDSPRIRRIVAQINSLKPDLIVLLGDYVSGIQPKKWTNLSPTAWTNALSDLKAPLGTYAVLGNHDCRFGAEGVTRHLETAGIPVLHNTATLLKTQTGARLWLAGLGDQRAVSLGSGRFLGEDDLAGTMRQVRGDTDPLILLAHEPDIFPAISSRVDLLLSGHTHGGQVRLPILGTPHVQSRHGQRYVYGHFVEDDRQMIVSGGLGCARLPMRFGIPPEIAIIEVA
ncbi:MAG: metallophosphoesterase [Hyphomicrobiales bacterium]|nr:metallophosphoesterase [Hyphomicrobiales bacterium]MCP5002267.1 metallophosphoesterase [Hyphomicrobiales bacterium]